MKLLLAHRSWIFWESGHLKLHWFQWLSLNCASYRNIFFLFTVNYKLRDYTIQYVSRWNKKSKVWNRHATCSDWQWNFFFFFFFTFITYGASWYHEEGPLWYIYFRLIGVPKRRRKNLGCNLDHLSGLLVHTFKCSVNTDKWLF